MAVNISRRWTQQPDGFVAADAYWLARRLSFLWSAATFPVESLTNRVRTTDNTAKSGAAAVGKVINCSTGQVNIEWNREFSLTSDGAGTGDFTMIALANPASSGAEVGHVFAQKNDAGGAPFAQACLLAQSGATAAFSSGAFCFFTFNNPTNAGVSVASACDGLWHVWAGRRSGSAHTLWKDGISIGSTSTTALGITQAASRYTAIGSRGNGTTESFVDKVAMAAMFNVALTDSEMLSLGVNPWQLFMPLQRRMYVNTAAAAGGWGGLLSNQRNRLAA